MSHPNHHSYRESIPPTALGLPINSHLFQLHYSSAQLKFMFFFFDISRWSRTNRMLVGSELVFFTQTNHGERRGYFWAADDVE